MDSDKIATDSPAQKRLIISCFWSFPYFAEAIRCSDRAHAIGLGRLYLKLFKNKFEWSELKDVLQNWNIDQGSAFRNLDAKDIEVGGLEQVISALNR